MRAGGHRGDAIEQAARADATGRDRDTNSAELPAENRLRRSASANSRQSAFPHDHPHFEYPQLRQTQQPASRTRVGAVHFGQAAPVG